MTPFAQRSPTTSTATLSDAARMEFQVVAVDVVGDRCANGVIRGVIRLCGDCADEPERENHKDKGGAHKT